MYDKSKYTLLSSVGCYLHIESGYTYPAYTNDTNNVLSIPFDIENPCHLDDIELLEWWKKLSEEDYKKLCLYHKPLETYTQQEIVNLQDYRPPFIIKEILPKYTTNSNNQVKYFEYKNGVIAYQPERNYNITIKGGGNIADITQSLQFIYEHLKEIAEKPEKVNKYNGAVYKEKHTLTLNISTQK